MRLFPIITALIVTAVLFLFVMQRDFLMGGAAGDDQGADATIAPIASDAIRVVVMDSQAAPVADQILLRGRSEAMRRVELRAETSGRIVSDPVRAGANVTAGDVICRIDQGTRAASLAEAQAAFETAQAQVAAAQIDDNAAQRLSESGFASDSRAAGAAASLAAAQAGLRGAQAAFDRISEDLSRTEIRAPFDGILDADSAELGTLMQPGALCARVLALDPIKFVGFLPEAAVARIREGQIAQARLVDGRVIDGAVTFVSRSSDPETRTFRVEITADNADLSIRDGQTADITIPTEASLAHLVPSSALTLDDGGVLGLRLADGGDVVRFAPINVLSDTAQGVYVAGLPQMARIIVVGQEFVTEGTQVIPVARPVGEVAQ